jgi:hypothetical protein
MKANQSNFNNIVESIYNLPLEFKEELKNLLEHNIADDRRKEIANNYKSALKEHASGKLKFSSSVDELKKML